MSIQRELVVLEFNTKTQWFKVQYFGLTYVCHMDQKWVDAYHSNAYYTTFQMALKRLPKGWHYTEEEYNKNRMSLIIDSTGSVDLIINGNKLEQLEYYTKEKEIQKIPFINYK